MSITINGDTGFSTDGGSTLINNATAAGNFTVQQDVIVNNNVGIKTSTPTATLDVVGNLKVGSSGGETVVSRTVTNVNITGTNGSITGSVYAQVSGGYTKFFLSISSITGTSTWNLTGGYVTGLYEVFQETSNFGVSPTPIQIAVGTQQIAQGGADYSVLAGYSLNIDEVYSANVIALSTDINNGNVGIGTSLPGARIDVNSGSGGVIGNFNSTNANGGYIRFQSSGTSIGDIGTAAQTVGGSASDFSINARPSGALVFGTVNTERARITPGGSFILGNKSSRNVNDFWYGSGASLGSVYIHLKTNKKATTEAQMYSVTFRGHSYGDSLPINASLCFYNYYGSGVPVNIGSYGTHACSAYKASDDYTVMTIYIPAHYYVAFTMDQFVTNQGLSELQITAYTTSASATGVY